MGFSRQVYWSGVPFPSPELLYFKTKDIRSYRGFPGGSMDKNPPANAGGHKFSAWSRKILHAVEQLSPCATTAEPECCNYRNPSALEPALCNKRSHCNEKATHHNEE